MNRTILFSGGMDSVALWLRYPDAHLVYVRIGAPYEERELNSLHERGIINRVTVLPTGKWLGPCSDSMGRVPLRNLFFAVAAAAGTPCDEVLLGATAGETSPDKSRAFAAAASAAMSQAEGRSIRLRMPFRHMTKRELVRQLLAGESSDIGRDKMVAMLRSCPSCYEPDLPRGFAGCGRCMSCVRRWVAFSLCGIHENYVTPPWQVDTTVKRGLLKYLRRTPVRDWYGVLRLNGELLRAKARQQRVAVGRF